MIKSAIITFIKCINLSVITGPVFDKELRVSSRRKRNYILRSTYVILLTLFVTIVWWATVSQNMRGGSFAFNLSRMSQAGLTVTTTIVWFQFLVTQLLAVIMLSTAISDEIYNKTLGVLMTTPINTFQIVMGKLLSKILQLFLFIGISLPLLSIVRIFGGIPWDFVITSLSINFTAILFAGSLSLYFSAGGKRSYEVIIKTVAVLGIIYILIPVICALVMNGMVKHIYIPERIMLPILLNTNPFFALQTKTMQMFQPGSLPYKVYIPVHCMLLLGISVILLMRSIVTVRRVALLQALGLSPADMKKEKIARKKNKNSKHGRQNGIIRPVTGSPVVWKEMRAPLIQGSRFNNIIGLMIAIGGLFFTYWMAFKGKSLHQEYAHASYSVMFMVLSIIMSMVVSATMITSEKESRSWPILLATSLDDRQILIGKAVGVFRRCWPVWIFLAAHMIIFILVGYIHPVALFHLVLLIFSLTAFLTGSGLYFSSCFKRTTTAVVANIALALIIWLVIPVMTGFCSEIFHKNKPFEICISLNPIVQNSVMMYGNAGDINARKPLTLLSYDWPWKDSASFSFTTLLISVTASAYTIAGVLMAWCAKKKLRKKIF